MVPYDRLQTFSGGNKGSLFGSSVVVNLVRVVASVSNNKTGILSWCTTASATLFCFVHAATVPFSATETLGLAEPLRLINRDVLKHS